MNWKQSLRAMINVVVLLTFAGYSAADAAWRPLLDANSFSQWTVEGGSKADYRLQGTTVIGMPGKEHSKNSFLCSPDRYKDFELRLAFRISTPELNSGVQFRSDVFDEGVKGPQLEMDVAGSKDFGFFRRLAMSLYSFIKSYPIWDYSSAGIYGEGLAMGWIFPGVAGGDNEAFEEQGTRLTDPGGWNEMRLLAEGARIQSWLAGEQRTDFEYADVDKPGVICLQVHGGDYDVPSDYTVEWKDLMIRELDQSASPGT